MRDGNKYQGGRTVAAVLEGVWRDSIVEPECSPEELAAVTPLLLSFGAGALGWRRIRHSELRDSTPGLELHQAYRLHALEAAVHEREIRAMIPYLQSRGIVPVLVKGWAIARLYPEPGLRPYGDLDLCVRREQYSASQSALADPECPRCSVDLHDTFAVLDELPADDLFERSTQVDIGGVAVRVLSPEDHLRVLCIHLLRHGVCRPLWLCDIGTAVESLPSDFCWNRCLTRNPRVADWVACAIGLAHRLLGVRVDGAPVAARARQLPQWLIPSVLRQWSTQFRPRAPISGLLSTPTVLIPELVRHWPNGVEATVGVRGSFNQFPRLPYQFRHCLSRTLRFLGGIPKWTAY